MCSTFCTRLGLLSLRESSRLHIPWPAEHTNLSLMVACHLEPTLADRWIAGKEIKNSEIRRALGKHPAGETEEKTRALYQFFSQTSHPNRDTIAHRFLN